MRQLGTGGFGRQRAWNLSRWLWQIDFFPTFSGAMQDHPISFPMDAEWFAVQQSREIDGLLGNAVPRQLQRVGGHPLPQGLEHFRRSSEVAIGRHEAVDPLVRRWKL